MEKIFHPLFSFLAHTNVTEEGEMREQEHGTICTTAGLH
jgi:hypothetical protein